MGSNNLQNESCVPSSGKVLTQIQQLYSAKESTQTKLDALKEIRLLFEKADSQWLFSDSCQGDTSDTLKMYSSLVTTLAQFTALPKCETDSGELSDAVYNTIPEKACGVTAVFLALVHKFELAKDSMSCGELKTSVAFIMKSISVPLFVFACTHCQNKPWTTAESRLLADQLVTTLVQTAGVGCVAELLRGKSEDDKGIFGPILGLMKPDLRKETWKVNPAAKHIFLWMLQQVTRPWLCNYLDSVLPASLMISDDYRNENKILGVCCLHHIILNVPAADLRHCNRSQVIYHALFNHLYTPEADLLQVVLPCLLDLLPVLEKSPQLTGQPRNANRYDDVLQLVLTHMEVEHKIPLRRVYAKNLPLFVEKLGILIVRHMKRLERVIVGYLEVYDGPEEVARLAVLQTLQYIIQHAWPRMGSRLSVLLKSLLRLLYDVSVDSSITPPLVKKALQQEATLCLILLDRCCQRKVKVILEGLQNSCKDAVVLDCIQKVLQVSCS
uniref:TELO2 interacting protein 2 n=1 Tax=Latimeria chalumnae TaxID=7897 RepID=H3BHI1_LATCH